MNRLKCSLLLCALLSSSAGWATEPRTVGDFALIDHQGKFHQLRYYGDQDAVVIFIQANGDPVVDKSLPAIHAAQQAYAEKHVTFFMLNAQVDDARDAIATEAADKGFEIPVLVDESQLVAESLGVERVAEVLVIDPKTMTLRYQGGVDGLDAVLSGDREPASGSISRGAKIAYVSREAHQQNVPSYSAEIAPMLAENCVSCHHDGAIAPWSMSSHDMILGWSAMMREVVLTRRMPPGQIDTHVGKAIDGAAGLTLEEKQKLVHWIDAGSPKDGEIDPLAELTFNDPRFSLGEPDLVYTVPAQAIPATGVVDYRYVPVDLDLDEDVWISAMEFVPGDRQVLHHVIAYLSSPADKTLRGKATGAARGEQIAGFAPGRQPDTFRDNSGRLIPKGSSLLLQMHYTTSGKETMDETQVGIYVYKKPPAYVMSSGVAGQRRFMVPPHVKEHRLEGEQLIERDAYLYEMTPHMHFRGKYMSYTAEYPDGSSELLLSVPKYDFNWQYSYPLAEPLFLPAGTRLVARGAMDNSDRNPGNPDPTRPVHFGLQTKHEMFFGFTTLRYVGDTPQSLAGEPAEDASGDGDEAAGR